MSGRFAAVSVWISNQHHSWARESAGQSALSRIATRLRKDA